MEYKMFYINKLAKNIDKVAGEEIRKQILKDCEGLTAKQKKEKQVEEMN